MASRFPILDRRRTQTTGTARERPVIISKDAVEIGSYVLATLVTLGHIPLIV